MRKKEIPVEKAMLVKVGKTLGLIIDGEWYILQSTLRTIVEENYNIGDLVRTKGMIIKNGRGGPMIIKDKDNENYF